jgi:hypothetical protein
MKLPTPAQIDELVANKLKLEIAERGNLPCVMSFYAFVPRFLFSIYNLHNVLFCVVQREHRHSWMKCRRSAPLLRELLESTYQSIYKPAT